MKNIGRFRIGWGRTPESPKRCVPALDYRYLQDLIRIPAGIPKKKEEISATVVDTLWHWHIEVLRPPAVQPLLRFL